MNRHRYLPHESFGPAADRFCARVSPVSICATLFRCPCRTLLLLKTRLVGYPFHQFCEIPPTPRLVKSGAALKKWAVLLQSCTNGVGEASTTSPHLIKKPWPKLAFPPRPTPGQLISKQLGGTTALRNLLCIHCSSLLSPF